MERLTRHGANETWGGKEEMERLESDDESKKESKGKVNMRR